MDMRQILVETHNAPMPNARVSYIIFFPLGISLSPFCKNILPLHPIRVFTNLLCSIASYSLQDMFFTLHDKGFVIFSKEANYENGAGGVEYAFVKVSTDFFVNNTMYMYHKT